MPWTAEIGWEEAVIPILPAEVGRRLRGLPRSLRTDMEEIRLRAGRCPELIAGGRQGFLTAAGWDGEPGEEDPAVSPAACGAVFRAAMEHSPYAREDEIRRGYVALRGGCRLGFGGEFLLREGRVCGLRECASVCIRIPHAVPAAGREAMAAVLGPNGGLRHTLVVSPPRMGKTTMLRDIARRLGNMGRRVVIVDERGEIAGCYRGVPTLDVGQTTDVLDGCPKTEGILMAVRALSPEVIVTDEVGAPGDAEALAEAARAGVTVLASAHGRCAEDLYRRVLLRPLLEGDAVERILVLERTGGVRRVRMEIPGERMRTCARF